jgi:antitoxin component of RelBE/YafQ-DinJ toxin-antitoxin module
MNATQQPSGSRRLLLTFRLDQEQRQRLKARLAREGRTMSEVVTRGLAQYVQRARHAAGAAAGAGAAAAAGAGAGAASASGAGSASAGPVVAREPVLPERVADRLRELRSSGRSELLSATLAALSEAGWPLRPLAEALGISKQAVQRRIRRRIPAELRGTVTHCEPPPPFPHRREASANGLRPHLTIKIDRALRAAAHQAAAREGSSLSQVVESILDRYLRHGMAGDDQPTPTPPASPAGPSPRPSPRPSSRRSTRIIRQASGASTGVSASKSP